ncbi:ATP-binding cassette domain-containing protein [Propioniciclava soli]|uniref:ATP-binding cassette domain-containing protein n=1 Tax=Propioniciclava soli TaxID=2775081 RepID=A0ABZ3C6F0_9ACTN
MIEFTSVTKQYPDGTVAVDDFSGQFPPHQTTVLLGSSGCGKTTILRMVNRMVEASSGTITIDGENIAQRDVVPLRRSIGYVMQNAGLLPHRRVIDNIATVPLLNGTPKAEAHARAEELMDLVGLDRSMARRYPNQLSGGQQQRVGVARGLAADPNILLMDEPFGAVDPLVRRDLQAELRRIQSELGKTIVFVTHDVEEAFTLGDQIIILANGGQVAQRGTSEEILAHPANDFVAGFIGLAQGERTLHRSPDGGGVLVDGHGRAVGVLAEEPAP